jgi:hypothetical protein
MMGQIRGTGFEVDQNQRRQRQTVHFSRNAMKISAR